jgi:hypothetical protein
MIAPLLLLAVQAEAAAPPSSETPVDYVISVTADRNECLFLPTDVGLTAKELTETLKTYDHSNGIEFIYDRRVPQKCLSIGRHAALAAGFTRIVARPATKSDEGHGRVPG